MSIPLPSDDTTVRTYEEALSETTVNQFLSLRQISVINATDEQLMDRVVNIYGIINTVNNLNELHKKVSVIDPTNTSGVSFIVNNINTNIVVKNIIRLTNVSLVSSSNGMVFAVNERKNFAQFYAFSYDYSSDNSDNYDILFTKNNIPFDCDKSVSKLLEEWFAKTFLQCYSFDKLSIPTEPSGVNRYSESYTDFACLVIASQLMSQSIQLTVYDGTKPSFNVENQYRTDFCQPSNLPSNQYHRLNTEVVFPKSLDSSRLVFVNIWRNKFKENTGHYDIAQRTSLIDGDDLLILFNVDLSKGSDESMKLNLRSGRQYGKGIRKVHRNSVLGRHLMAKIRERELQTNTQTLNSYINDLPESLSSCLSDNTILSPEMNELLSLGSRKLQALYEQQLNEQKFPHFYRNDFKYDLKTIETVLQKSRQLSTFPKRSFVGTVPRMRSIESLKTLGAESVVIKAKIIDHFPKSVFPTNEFVFVYCNSCYFTETFKSLVQKSNDIDFDCRESHECPDCSHSRIISKLVYFYAFIFIIKESNCETRVCLTKDNAITVFGVDAQQLLEDSDSALSVDNILMEILRISDEYSIDWIIKKADTGAVEQDFYEVISLSPNN